MKIRLKLSGNDGGMYRNKPIQHDIICEYPTTKKLLSDLEEIVQRDYITPCKAILATINHIAYEGVYDPEYKDMVLYYFMESNGSVTELKNTMETLLSQNINFAGRSFPARWLVNSSYNNVYYKKPTVMYY